VFVVDLISLLMIMIPDIIWKVTVHGIDVKFGLVPVYFIYLSFRNEFTKILPLFVLQLILLRPFMIFGFFPLSVALLTVLFIANRVRLKIYTEAYLTQGMWVFFLAILYHLILHLLAVNLYTALMMPTMVIEILANSLLAALSAVPLFLFLDRLHDALGGSRRGPKGNTFMIRRL
jgi:hypothetical protein